VAILYNLSESAFSRMGLIWFTTLLMLLEFPKNALAARIQGTLPKTAERIPDHQARAFANF
jgi:hypothetical protein